MNQKLNKVRELKGLLLLNIREWEKTDYFDDTILLSTPSKIEIKKTEHIILKLDEVVKMIKSLMLFEDKKQ